MILRLNVQCTVVKSRHPDVLSPLSPLPRSFDFKNFSGTIHYVYVLPKGLV